MMANVPALPGTVPIPEGHVRLFHYTHGDPQSVLRDGLLMSHAKGENYGEPSVIWASGRMPQNSLDLGNPVVEFHVPADDPRWLIGKYSPGVKYDPQIDSNDPGQVKAWMDHLHAANSHVTFGGDIDPSEIIAVHEPWHSHYRYFQDNDLDPNDYQWIKDRPEAMPDEHKALQEYEKMKVHTHWKETYTPDQGGGDPRPDRSPWEERDLTLPGPVTPLGPYCPECGYPRDAEGVYCPQCGHRTNPDIVNERIKEYAPLGEGIGEGPFGLATSKWYRPVKLAGFRTWSADIGELAAQKRQEAFENLKPWSEKQWEYLRKKFEEAGDHDRAGNGWPWYWNRIKNIINTIPDQGYKLIPWAVREIKRGMLEGEQYYGHITDILTQAAQWFDWSREHNQSLPDYMNKQFGFSELESWVYEMNNRKNESPDRWTDSTPVYKWDDGWTMDLVGADDLAREGELMGHCVGGYGYCDQVKRGETSIFSLRDPKGQPHVTIEVVGDFDGKSAPVSKPQYTGEPLTVVQVQGKQDTEPIPEYRHYVDDWFETLRVNGWDVEEQDPEREPEYEYVEHPDGPVPFEDHDDFLKYHDLMHSDWDRDYSFGYDEEPDINGNVWTYQNPRRLDLPQTPVEWAEKARDFINEWQKGKYSDEDAVHMVQSMWLALLHSQEDDQYGTLPWTRDEKERKEFWNSIIETLTHLTQHDPTKAKNPTLFDPSKFDTPYQSQEAMAFILQMKKMEDAPTQWQVPLQRRQRDPETDKPLYQHKDTGEITTDINAKDEEGNYAGPNHALYEPDLDELGVQKTKTEQFHLPSTDGYSPTNLTNYFKIHGLDELTPHPWTVQSAQKWYNDPDRSRWEYPRSDTDLGFQVGDRVGLPSGEEGTVTELDPPEENEDGTITHWLRVKLDSGQRVVAPDVAVRFIQGLEGQSMPDTLPWSEQEQDYYRTSAWWLPNKTAANIQELAAQARQKLWQRPDLAKMLETTWQVEGALGYRPEDGPPSPEELKGLELAVQAYKRNKDWNTWGPGGIAETLRTQYGYSEDSIKRFVNLAPKVFPIWDEYIRGNLFKEFLSELERQYPASYKLWPWAVKRLKNQIKADTPYYDEYITDFRNWQHYVDIVGGAGELLNTLRQENRTPADFDINQVADFQDLEAWLQAYRAENVGEGWQKRDVVYQSPEGWTVEDVTTPDDLTREGELMGHCVGGYCNRVAGGGIKIFSLRDPKGMPHATMEYVPVYEQTNEDGTPTDPNASQWIDSNKIIRYKVQQIQGKQNRAPNPEYIQQIKEFNEYLHSQGYTVEWSANSWRHNDYNKAVREQLRNENLYPVQGIEGLNQLNVDYHNNNGVQHFTEQHPPIPDTYGIQSESMVPKRWLDNGQMHDVTDEILYQIYAGNADEQAQMDYARKLVIGWYSLLSQPYSSNPKDFQPKSVLDARSWLVRFIDSWIYHLRESQGSNQWSDQGLDNVARFNNLIRSTNGTMWQKIITPTPPDQGFDEDWKPGYWTQTFGESPFDSQFRTRSNWKLARTTMFHVSPKSRRESIKEQGLVMDQPTTWGPRDEHHDPEIGQGIYLWDTPHNARLYAQRAQPITDPDIWAVDVTGLNLQEDPFFDPNTEVERLRELNLPNVSLPPSARDLYRGPHGIPGAFVTQDNIQPNRLHLVEPNPWYPEPSSKDYWNEDTEQFEGRPSLISSWKLAHEPRFKPGDLVVRDGYVGTVVFGKFDPNVRETFYRVDFGPEDVARHYWESELISPEDWHGGDPRALKNIPRVAGELPAGVPPMRFDDIWRYRVPFYVVPDGTHEVGLPGDEHYDIEERRWFKQKYPDIPEGEMQGHVIFHPEYGEVPIWPEWLKDENLKNTILDRARGMYDYGFAESDLPPRKSGIWKFAVSAIPAQYSPEDPLDLQGKQPVFNNMQVDWMNLPDTEQQQAVVNAFRATMLSPRLKLRDNAIMYQEMMDIPFNESDPDVFEQHARDVKERWDRQGQGDLMGEVEPMGWEQQVPGKLTPGFWTNIRRLAALGPYADELRDAAVTDMEEFGGSGKYFREQVLKMGIPGVGPKVASFAWLALNPKGSDLGTLDVWMMRHLNQDVESPNNPSHYFELENQLRDEKDALYGADTPLGQYQWGVWDKLRTPGLHQDHSPLRVYDPTPYNQVSWGDFARAPRPKVAPEQHPDQEQLFANAK